MTHAAAGMGRAVAACAYAPRKRVTACLLILIAVVFTIAVLTAANSRLPREEKMEQKLANMQAHIQFLETLYRERQEEILKLQSRFRGDQNAAARFFTQETTTLTPEISALLKNLSGSHAATGLHPKNLLLQAPFVYQLLPHLMNDPHSLRPAYHMKGPRNFTDIVLGIPTVKRDKESYLLITLEHLIDGLTETDLNTTLIVVYVGETDLEYVLTVARQEIKEFTASISVSNPQWFFIEYCPIGGIGKLFRSSDLLHFITYVQLFYHNLPIDWLLESYLADRICTIDKTSKGCKKNKLLIRPKYKTSLFQHIGLYSSLKGKIQKIKDAQFGTVPTFYPHENPTLDSLKTDIEEHSGHTLLKAYEGQTYFWGIKPKRGDTVEFWFAQPTRLKRYTFRSGNVEHVSDKFYNSVVEVLPMGNANFTKVGTFDEFGMADGNLSKHLSPLNAIRIRVERDSTYWVILSETTFPDDRTVKKIRGIGLWDVLFAIVEATVVKK